MSIPVVPFSAFRSLAGEALAADLAQLMAKGEFSELVLFSDLYGLRLALLAVGEGRRHTQLSELVGVEIDGLRALCAVRKGAGLQKDHIEQLEERIQEVTRMEQNLKSRAAYIEECEHRMADVGHNLSEREAMIEQREHLLEEREREFFRRNGDLKPAGVATESEPAAKQAEI